ncbi:NADP-dependent isocitrate dehydrogenase, partial [bacterium]|nr:NADP-dependent isocitrate dehydrogenase [bacterium]
MRTSDFYRIPQGGFPITIGNDGNIYTPDTPIVPFIAGCGTATKLFPIVQKVLDSAVQYAYRGKRKICWMEVFAGQKAYTLLEEWLPQQTLDYIRSFHLCFKMPISTVKGTDFQTLEKTIRQELGLYASVYKIRYLKGMPSPVKRPELVDIVLFCENSEDINAGLEWPAGSEESSRIIELLNDEIGCTISRDSGIGIKPISVTASQKLIRKAIQYAYNHQRKAVTIVHKDDVMKFTEGAFRDWGYQLAKEEFPNIVITEKDVLLNHDGVLPDDKILLSDRIADIVLQQILSHPEEYSVLAMLYLNGDYIYNVLTAQVGGTAMHHCSYYGDNCVFFDTIDDPLKKNAREDTINPYPILLSGAEMLDFLGWREASACIIEALQKTILEKKVTCGLGHLFEKTVILSCSEVCNAVIG